jgi:hypothetical protein
MTARLYPTPHRLRIVAEAETGTLPHLLDQRAAELAAAGWLERIPDGDTWRWAPTAYARAITAVRIAEHGKHLTAETGDATEPRRLGDAWCYERGYWLVKIAELHATASTKTEARELLWHMAARHLADNPTTVQEGQC